MKFIIIIAIAFVLLIPVISFAQYYKPIEHYDNNGELLSNYTASPRTGVSFYSNEKFDFSFESHVYWKYQESVTIIDGRVDEVVFFPAAFFISVADDDANLDAQTKRLEWTWQLESPVIGMDYENIPISKIKVMNEHSIRDYHLDFILERYPGAKMTDIYSKTHSYGWEVGVTYFVDVDKGFGKSIPYMGMEKAFFFKDREKYALYYGASHAYFDEYKPFYDKAVDTLIIKSVAVPEFGSIAMLILAVSIVSIVLVFRKFNFLVLR